MTTVHQRPGPRAQAPWRAMLAAVSRLERAARPLALPEPVAQECRGPLAALRMAVRRHDVRGIIHHSDLFVRAVTRNLGAEIALRRGYELVDGAIMDVKRPVGDPGQIFTEARAFIQRFNELAEVAGAPPSLPIRADVTGGDSAREALDLAIRSYCLPEEIALGLQQQVAEIAAMARTADPANELRWIQTVAGFSRTLTSLQGSYLSITQTNYLLGIIFMGWPAALCWCPVAWLVQAVVVIGGVAIYVVHRSRRKARAFERIKNYIQKNPNASKQDIENETKNAVKDEDLDADDKKELKKDLSNIGAAQPDSAVGQKYTDASGVVE